MSIAPGEHAGLIVAHYLRALAERAGLRWTAANDADMRMLGELFDQAGAELDCIPPFQANDNNVNIDHPLIRSDRTTVVFDREPEGNDGIPDQRFQQWRGQQRYTEDDDVRRLVRR